MTIILEENIGLVPVDVTIEGGDPVFARFKTAMLPEHRESPHSYQDLARMVGLKPRGYLPRRTFSRNGLMWLAISCHSRPND
ncbi:MAG: hypothetical protein Ct9H300mP15_00570 [Gemmatimonadota bacterium]|nr:MAG: hypothetical protein Ct9H300mP15_00570 [Gemmatimonadota bacterium]